MQDHDTYLFERRAIIEKKMQIGIDRAKYFATALKPSETHKISIVELKVEELKSLTMKELRIKLHEQLLELDSLGDKIETGATLKDTYDPYINSRKLTKQIELTVHAYRESLKDAIEEKKKK